MINLKSPFVGLSPMDGITDEAFRLTLCHFAKPDLIFTEFVSAEGLAHGGLRLFDHLLYSPLERPIIGQLFGKDPDSFYTASLILCFLGFDGVDINMGCPAKTVVHHGSGAALIGKPQLASEIIKSVQSAVTDFSQNKIKLSQLKLKDKILKIIKNQSHPNKSLPTVSIKTRIGLNTSQINNWIPHLVSHQPDFITLHGRTLSQGYSGSANWNEIGRAVSLANHVPIIGNGDIQSRQQGIEYCQKYGTVGALIGRAALGNPWVFVNQNPSPENRFQAALYHFQIFCQIFPQRPTDSLRRHLLAYASGLPHAKKLRQQLVRVNTVADLLLLENQFLDC